MTNFFNTILEEFPEVAEIKEDEFYPIGEIARGNMILLMTNEGKFFSYTDGCLVKNGENISEKGIKYRITAIDNGENSYPSMIYYESVEIPEGKVSSPPQPKDRWFMFSLPYESTDKSIAAVLKELGDESTQTWKIYRTDSS